MTIELVLSDTVGNKIFRDKNFPVREVPRIGEKINFYVTQREREYLFNVVSVTHDYGSPRQPVIVVAKYQGDVTKD